MALVKLGKSQTIHEYFKVLEQTLNDIFSDTSAINIHVILLDHDLIQAFKLEDQHSVSFNKIKIESSMSGYIEVERDGKGLTQKEIEIGTFTNYKISFCTYGTQVRKGEICRSKKVIYV